MTVEEARAVFGAVPMIARKLQTLVDVGLSYVRLGQRATTLSGGEAQRVKLSASCPSATPAAPSTSSTSRRRGCTSTTPNSSCAYSTGCATTATPSSSSSTTWKW